MDSLFSRLYKYAWSVKKHSRENYLTEILAFALQHNRPLLSAFLDTIHCYPSEGEVHVRTQQRDSQTGIPDIVLEIGDDTLVIIEVKVDSREGEEQLRRYAEYLLSNERPRKHLVYLTKKSETKELDVKDFHFSHLRWFEVFKMLEGFEDTVSSEFKEYLIEEGMSRKMEFNPGQSTAIADYKRFIESASSFLAEYKDELRKNGVADFVDKSNYEKGEIGVSVTQFCFPIWCGFYQSSNEVKLGVSLDNFSVEHSRFKEIESKFDQVENIDSYKVSFKSKEFVTFFTQYSFSSFFNDKSFDEDRALKVLLEDTLRMKSIINDKNKPNT